MTSQIKLFKTGVKMLGAWVPADTRHFSRELNIAICNLNSWPRTLLKMLYPQLQVMCKGPHYKTWSTLTP